MQRQKPALCSYLLALLYFLICPLNVGHGQTQFPGNGRESDPPTYVSNEVLVKFRSAASPGSRARAHAALAATTVRRYRLVRDLELVRLPQGASVQTALRKYGRDPNVSYAEPNYVRHKFDTPNDPMFPQLWSLSNTGQSGGLAGADIHAPQAWALSTGSRQVVVAVVDTGIDYTHEDLAANMWRNVPDCNQNGIDDDGNGYVDDCYGINTVYGNSDPIDDHNHGTHVAGIIGAAGNNGIGGVGVNWQVGIMACKFLDDWGYGSDAGAIGCLEYVAAMKQRGVNIVATNNSWGGSGYSRALYEAIDAQRQAGILFIAAAGNWGDTNDGASPNYPSSFDLSNIIAVAATTNTDSLAYFSSFGRRTVHLGAPGMMIFSTTRHNLYRAYSGTSMATPHVVGVVALLAAQDPARDWKTIRNLILAGGTPFNTLSQTITGRRLSALGSMTCTDSTVLAALRPSIAPVMASSGHPVVFSALNINCGAPAGNVTVTISPGGQQVTLTDTGQAPDQEPNDGIYAGQWVPTSAGTYTFTFPDGQSGTIIVDAYTFSSTQFEYRNVTGTGIALNDDSGAWIESPFPISYAGSAYNGLIVGDNGLITFDYWPAVGPNKPLPSAQSTTLVAPFWDDLFPVGLQRNVFWQVNGSTPNRELIVEWRDLSTFACSAGEGIKFQAVFAENSPNILFNYADVTFGGSCADHNGGALATIGVQFSERGATQYSFATPSIQDQTALVANVQMPQNPVPSITSINPSSWSTSTQPTTMLIKGTNLQSGSIMLWNGRPRTTYYLSEGSLYGLLDYGDLSSKGTAQISVFNALPGGGTSNTLPFTIGDPDFMLVSDVSTRTIAPGESAQFMLWTTGQPAWSGAVSLACSTVPANVTCSFSPQTIAENEYSQLTVSFTKSATAQHVNRNAGIWAAVFLFLPVGAVLLTGLCRQSRRAAIVAVSLLICLLLVYSGCGGNKTSPSNYQAPSTGPTTPSTGPVTYNIVVTGSSGILQHSRSLSVAVMP